MSKNVVKNALVNAGATVAYVVLIASFFTHAKDIFGETKEDTVIIPIIMLLLLVISVAIMGLTIFGRPIVWYLEGKKRKHCI